LSVIPATREVEAGRLQIGDQPQLTFEPSWCKVSKTLT
jgi:hypothetical protein